LKLRTGKRKRISAWLLLLLVLAAAMLFWLSWLGGETPTTLQEIPVEMPADKAGSHN
jgi:multidrug resistance efflux pump